MADLISSGIGTNPRRQASWTSSNGLQTSGTLNPLGLTQNDSSVGYMGETPQPDATAQPQPAPSTATSQNAQIATTNTDPNGAAAYDAQKQAAAQGQNQPSLSSGNPLNMLMTQPNAAPPSTLSPDNSLSQLVTQQPQPTSPLSAGNPLNSLISTGMSTPSSAPPTDPLTDPAAQARQMLSQYGSGQSLQPMMGPWGNQHRRFMTNGARPTLQSGAILNGAPR